MKPKPGPTGTFPDGKIAQDDQGATMIAVTSDERFVHINFAVPVTWLAMGPYEARRLAEAILEHVEQLKPTVKQ